MELRPIIGVVLCSIIVLSEVCESKLKKVFSPKHDCQPDELCNTTKYYPENEIKKILGKSKRKFELLSGPVMEPGESIQVPQVRNSLEESEGVNLCRTRKVTVVPKTGFNIDMKPRYIVNVDGYEQVLTYETCADNSTNRECFGNGIMPNAFKTFCMQTYNIVRLVAINNAGRLEYGRFRIPSNCVCSYKRDTRHT